MPGLPAYEVATCPKASWTVTVAVAGVPATTLPGSEKVKDVAGPCTTSSDAVAERSPLLAVMVSVPNAVVEVMVAV